MPHLSLHTALLIECPIYPNQIPSLSLPNTKPILTKFPIYPNLISNLSLLNAQPTHPHTLYINSKQTYSNLFLSNAEYPIYSYQLPSLAFLNSQPILSQFPTIPFQIPNLSFPNSQPFISKFPTYPSQNSQYNLTNYPTYPYQLLILSYLPNAQPYPYYQITKIPTQPILYQCVLSLNPTHSH